MTNRDSADEIQGETSRGGTSQSGTSQSGTSQSGTSHEDNPKLDPNPPDNTQKNPDDWVSGDDPMTGAQMSYLKTLSEQAKQPDQFAEGLSKAEASKRIDALKASLSA